MEFEIDCETEEETADAVAPGSSFCNEPITMPGPICIG
jgi:hypothetical protein